MQRGFLCAGARTLVGTDRPAHALPRLCNDCEVSETDHFDRADRNHFFDRPIHAGDHHTLRIDFARAVEGVIDGPFTRAQPIDERPDDSASGDFPTSIASEDSDFWYVHGKQLRRGL